MRKRLFYFYSSSSSRHTFVFDAFGGNTSRPEQTHEYDDDDEWWYFKKRVKSDLSLVLLLMILHHRLHNIRNTYNELFSFLFLHFSLTRLLTTYTLAILVLKKNNVSSNGVDRRHRSLPHITNRQIEHDFVVNESHMHDRCEIANGGGVIETLRSWDVRRAI